VTGVQTCALPISTARPTRTSRPGSTSEPRPAAAAEPGARRQRRAPVRRARSDDALALRAQTLDAHLDDVADGEVGETTRQRDAGVPVLIRSPGSSTRYCDRCHTIVATSKIRSAVVES